MGDVVRVRMFVTDIADADAVSAAFTRALKPTRPCGTLVADRRARRPAVQGRDRGRRGDRQRAVTTQFELTDDQLAIQDMARRFTADAITPHAAEWDEKHIFPQGHDQGRRRARLRGDLRLGGERRDRARAARGGADHGGDGLWLPLDQRVHLDPQHGRVDARPVRLGGGQGQVPAPARRHGVDGELLPDRAGVRLGCGGAQDHRGARRRPLGGQRHQAVHQRRRRERPLPDDGPHRRGRAQGHLVPGDREGHARRQLRRAREEARLAFASRPRR